MLFIVKIVKGMWRISSLYNPARSRLLSINTWTHNNYKQRNAYLEPHRLVLLDEACRKTKQETKQETNHETNQVVATTTNLKPNCRTTDGKTDPIDTNAYLSTVSFTCCYICSVTGFVIGSAVAGHYTF